MMNLVDVYEQTIAVGSDLMKYRYTLLITICVGLLGGCFNMDASNNENTYEAENFVPIDDYTGEGFTLRGADPKTGEIAEEHREEVVTAVEDYFETNYKTEIEVHNIVSAVDAVSVFVESVGEPHFYTIAIVPVDLENNAVQTDDVWTQEGEVEDGIQGGLYAMANSDRFEELDNFLTEISEKYPVTGTPEAVIEGVKGNGYMTPYYFITTYGEELKKAFHEYLENPHITAEELDAFFKEHLVSSDRVTIAIEFYMEDSEQEPDEQVFEDIYEELQAQDLPPGEYYLFLNDGLIDKRRGIGKKENTIEKTFQIDH